MTSILNPTELKQQRRLLVIWCITFLIIFPFLISLGLMMRMNQGGLADLPPNTFYSYMTMHGLGMAGILFSITLGAANYLISSRYVKLKIGFQYFVYFLILIGFLTLIFATIIGGFAAGWYVLYPLPFIGASWPAWSTALTTVSLIVLGVAWLLGSMHVLLALAKRYGGFSRLMGWNYIVGKTPDEPLPPMAMIATVALVPAVLSFLSAAVFLVMFLFQYFEPSLAFDPLFMKNMIFFFGHVIVNITMYLAVGWVYTLLPEYSKRDWGVDRIFAISWNGSFIFIIFAYLHHLYMDFAQPSGLQFAGQIASYLSAVPVTVVTMFGVIGQLYHSKVKWTMVPFVFLLGTMGWAIGGFAALVDSTIYVNKVLHNTLWVPAHFHTYMLAGVVLYIFGFLYYFSTPEAERKTENYSKLGIWIYLIGVYGFLLMFYLGGMNSVPRRYDKYVGITVGDVQSTGMLLARIAAYFVMAILAGLLVMYVSLITRIAKKFNE
ncbi:MAG: cbb3-type cytochrome c oxidase subunit I [Chitinophagales bacterium]|nr:cbb3-type cytochrome c oxidase subunit I [Chitinophagales bacterium]